MKKILFENDYAKLINKYHYISKFNNFYLKMIKQLINKYYISKM